jgi:hypothetical protein
LISNANFLWYLRQNSHPRFFYAWQSHIDSVFIDIKRKFSLVFTTKQHPPFFYAWQSQSLWPPASAADPAAVPSKGPWQSLYSLAVSVAVAVGGGQGHAYIRCCFCVGRFRPMLQRDTKRVWRPVRFVCGFVRSHCARCVCLHGSGWQHCLSNGTLFLRAVVCG